ncbi:hypothetical protein FB45DRAFT_860041 [Roridomyces roridus]|uniref:Uncharacterized protein n=1 Tax=Roridomyces roridus TaxID=1738132 RepID=A0AAD7CDN8_9AGAR|nr:hypothetical protein FB45DRAFT_860041 [Roridomyces roridus]
MNHGHLFGIPNCTNEQLDQMIEANNEALRNVHIDWFTDPLLIGDGATFLWSTRWKDFDLIDFWLDRTVDGQLKIDKLLKETWVVPGTIEMLAFLPRSMGLYFLFAAGGEYYFWTDRVLKKHSKKFGSHQEFVDHATKAEGWKQGLNLPDVVVPQAAETDFLWWEV